MYAAHAAAITSRIPSDAYGKLECCPICKHRLEPCAFVQLQLAHAEGEAGLPDCAAWRPEPRQIDEPAERQEGLLSYVRRRLLAPDVLLARLQGRT
jgi:hypothetical protein